MTAVPYLPTRALVSAKLLELRRRHGLMVVVGLLTVGLPYLVLGIRLVFHLVDAKSYGPAGSPSVFAGLSNPMAEFGFIAAASLGASAGTTDLSDGVFRHLVITGKSRLALYLARIPAGLSILLPLVGIAFAGLCLVTAFAGTPNPTSVQLNGAAVPLQLNEAQLKSWILQHPSQAEQAFGGVRASISKQGAAGGPVAVPINPRQLVKHHMAAVYELYATDTPGALIPPANEMAKIGLWIELDVVIGFMVGLGVGSLIGQRTAATVLMIVLEIIVTPILANVTIPYFLNGQRLLVGVAMDQLRPAGLAGGLGGAHPGRAILGGRAALGIPAMPTWAMVTVIVGWIVGWSILGAWRMMTRDA